MSATAFDSGHDGSVTQTPTHSKTWALGNVYLFTVTNFDGTAAVTPTIAGCTQVLNVVQSPNVQITVFRFLGDGATNAKTIDCGGSTQTSIQWIVDELPGLDTGGTNASNALLQPMSNTGGGSGAMLVTLGAFGSVNNGTWGFGWNQGGDPETAGSGFTGLSSEAGFYQILSQYKATNDTSVDMTNTATSDWVMIGIELKAAGGSPPPVLPPLSFTPQYQSLVAQ